MKLIQFTQLRLVGILGFGMPTMTQLVNYDVTNSAYILASVKLQDHSSLQNRTSNIFEQAENLELDFLDKGNIF